MKNRLEVAKDLLRGDGFLCVSIDHNELVYLTALIDEIFGQNNRLGIISVVHKPEGRQTTKFCNPTNEFLLIYSKNKLSATFRRIFKNPEILKVVKVDDKGHYTLKNFLNNDMMSRVSRHIKPKFWYPIYISSDLQNISLSKVTGYHEIWPITGKGLAKTWNTTKSTTKTRILKNELIATKINNKLIIKYKNRDGERVKTHWDDKRYNATVYGTKHLKKLIGENHFSFPKSIHLVIDILKITTGKNDAVLDFFAGSGTTGEAVFRLNQEDGGQRKFVLIEQLQEHIEVCLKRLTKTLQTENINDDFIYSQLAKLNQSIAEKIKRCSNDDQLMKIIKHLQSSGFLRAEFDFKQLKSSRVDWQNLSITTKKNIILDALDPNQLYLNLAEIDDARYNVSAQDKALMRDFYN